MSRHRRSPDMIRRARYFFEYGMVRAATSLVCLLPRSVALRLGAGLGRLCHVLGIYRRIVRKNMEFVNLWSPGEQRRITRDLYTTMGKYLADFLRSPAVCPPVPVDEVHHVEDTSAQGTGVLAIFAHFGNWELLPSLFAARSNGLSVVAKPMRNPFLHRWLMHTRLRSDIAVILSHRAVRPSLRALQQGRTVAVAIDQYAGSEGTSVPFLGKSTRTVRTVAGLAAHTGCQVVAAYALIQPDTTYRVVVESVPRPNVFSEDREELISALQEAHNQMISRWIEQHPEHWFGWFHRRFKDVLEYRTR